MELRFEKYEGIGNDFLVVDGNDEAARALSPEVVRALCDRHRGVGGDGVLIVGTTPRLSMRVINADGSIPEMCGNGLRCVALHVRRAGLSASPSFVVDTDAGPHECHVSSADVEALVEVEMRVPTLVPSAVPVVSDGPLVDGTFPVDDRSLAVTCVSMGNPHVVTFDDVGDARFSLGPRLERDPRFPEGVNVGFARPRGDGGLVLHVFERGAGWTEACGTGACAAAVAAVETGRAARGTPIPVRLPGGELVIRVGAEGERVRMTGPARHVFSGRVDLSRFGGGR
ncbi:MAG: diaminopimelate epimerase [Polyangiales bacterium]